MSAPYVEIIDATTEISHLTSSLITYFKDLHAKMGNELLAINRRTGTFITGYTYDQFNHLENRNT